MKRLIEEPTPDPLTARASALVRALGPTVESEERLRRVRRALDAPPRARKARWSVRVALATALLGATAAAASQSAVLSGLFSEDPPAVAPPSVATAAPPLVPNRRSPIAPATPSPPFEAASPSPTSDASSRVAPRGSARPEPPALSSEVARVHEAAKALRRDGRPARALELLERSGKPISGPLAEEALALRIEALSALGDGRRVSLSQAYLRQFPNGRYRELAKKAIAGRAP